MAAAAVAAVSPVVDAAAAVETFADDYFAGVGRFIRAAS